MDRSPGDLPRPVRGAAAVHEPDAPGERPLRRDRDLDHAPVAAQPPASLRERIAEYARELGFDDVGFTRLQPSEHADFYRAWLAAGRHGSMTYLARPDAVARRLDPAAGWPGLVSAVVLAHSYITAASSLDSADDPSVGVIARYARGRDYHKVLKQKLLALLRRIEGDVGHPLPLARAYVDTGPVLERELASRAGLGWFGRNTMLLHPRRGSYFFIASLLLELELEPGPPFQRDHCGSCNACVSACPTGALLGRDASGAPVIDATRCISYLTIEQRGPIPRELRPLIGNRVFGCDICQEVCPFTQRFTKMTSEPAFAARAPGQAPFGVQLEAGASRSHPGTASPSLIALLETALDEAAWDAFSGGSAIRRAGRAGFARNVCVALGNWGSPDAVPVLTKALSDPEPLTRAHAAWALGEVSSPASLAALQAARAAECDPLVLEELPVALA